MRSSMTREQKKKLLLAEGALYRFECMQARRALAGELEGIAHAGPSGVLRAVSGRSVTSLLLTALPLVLGAGRVARLLKRGMLVAGGVAANQAIRGALGDLATAHGLPFVAPPLWHRPSLCVWSVGNGPKVR